MEHIGLRSSLVECSIEEFLNLKDECYEKQLVAIFGSFEADQILNPNILETRKENGNICEHPVMKVDGTGAVELWEMLRSHSQNKLMQRVATFENNNEYCKSKSASVIDRVEVYKHRVNLMHKIAQLNEVKAGRLIQRINLPKLTGIWDCNIKKSGTTSCNFPSMIPDARLPEVAPLHQNQRVNVNTKVSKKLYLIDQNRNIGDMKIDNRKIRFLHETDTIFCGEFRNRMNTQGIDSSVGISNASHTYKADRKKTEIKPGSYSRNARSSNLDMKKNLDALKNSRKVTSLPPITIDSLVKECESVYKNKTNVSGKGII